MTNVNHLRYVMEVLGQDGRPIMPPKPAFNINKSIVLGDFLVSTNHFCANSDFTPLHATQGRTPPLVTLRFSHSLGGTSRHEFHRCVLMSVSLTNSPMDRTLPMTVAEWKYVSERSELNWPDCHNLPDPAPPNWRHNGF